MNIGWFPLVLFYILTNASSKVLQKVSVRDEAIDPKAFCVAFLFISGFLTLPFLALEPLRLSPDYRGWLALLVSALGAGIYMVLYYHGIKKIEVSQAETISTTRAVWAMLIGVVFFGETLSLGNIIGVVLIILAIASIYWHKGEFSSFGLHHWMIAAYALMITIGYAFDKYAVSFFSVVAYQILLYWGSALCTLVIFPGTLQKMTPFFTWNRQTPVFLLCFALQAISSLAILRAYQVGGSFSVVGPMAQTTTLLTIFIGIVFLRERWNLKRKLIGIALAVAGVLFLRVFNF